MITFFYGDGISMNVFIKKAGFIKGKIYGNAVSKIV
jgi:hypothetical protein